MRRTVSLVLMSILVGGGVVSCSKADSSSTGSAPPVNDPGSRSGGVVGGPRGAVGGPGGVVGGPKGAEGAMVVAPAAEGAPGAPDPEYQLDVVPSEPAALSNTFDVRVTPGKGFHMNKDYPTKLTLELPAGVSSPKAVLEPADAAAFTDDQLAFAIKLTATAKGDYTIPAVLKFAVCTDATCNPKKQSIALQLKAQ